jgi:putative transposase
MSHTYSSNRVHVVFSTKERQKRLPEDLQPKLWAYMAGVAHIHGFESPKIGGAVDHVHALLVIPPSMPLAKAVQAMKGCSSKWLNDTGLAGNNFAWQEGYGLSA